MKIPPKILKHHVKVSNEDAPAEAPFFTETPPEPISVDQIEPLTTEPVASPEPIAPAKTETEKVPVQQAKPVLKPQVIGNIPKPSPVQKIKTAEPVASPTEVAQVDIIDIESSEPQIDKAQSDTKNAKKPAGKMKRPARPVKSTANRESTAGSSLARRIQSQTDLQKSPDSLPVLEAFQDFLDSEQRRMHKRIVALSVIFSIVTLSLIAAGVAAAYYIVNPLKSEVNTFRSAISSLEQTATSTKQDNVTIVTSLNRMIEHERAINRDTASEIATQVTSYGDNLIEVKDLITKLQSENDALKSQLGSINKDLPDVTYKVAAIMNEIDKMRAPASVRSTAHISQPADNRGLIEPETRTDEPSVIAEGASTKTYSAMISFIPQGNDKRVVCLLPIRE